MAASRLSSVWARAALALGLLAVAAVVAGFALTRGSDEDEETERRREAVIGFIAQVNTANQASILALERVAETYRTLRLRPDEDPAELKRVREAEQALRRLRTRVGALAPPADARKLHRLVLALLDQQVELAAEVRGVVEYLPVQEREATRYAAASRRLNRDLRAATTAAEQAAAFAAYRRTVAAVATRLDDADAPPVLEPTRVEEVQRLRKLVREAVLVADALLGQDAAVIDQRFRRFVHTNASTGTSKAERAAVVAYNRRVGEVTDAREALAQERERVDLALR